MLALNSGHTVGDIATPDLIRLANGKLPIKMISDINAFLVCFSISMNRLLTTDQLQ